MSPTINIKQSYIISAGLLTSILWGIAAYFQIYFLVLLPFAVGLIGLCIFRPHYYALLLCFLVPLSVFIDDVGGGLGLSIPTEPMIMLLFFMYIVSSIIKGEINKEILTQPLIIIILINTIWMLVTVFTSTMPLISLKHFIARLWFLGIFLFFMIEVFKNANNIKRFLSLIIIATLIVVSYTLIKHSAEAFSRGWGYMIMRPFYSDHTIYAAAVAIVVPPAFLFAFRGGLLKISVITQIFYLIVGLILITGLIFSYTRASWISLIAAMAFYFIIKLRIKFTTLLLFLFSIVILFFSYQNKILYQLEANKKGSADDMETHVKSVSNITTDPSNLERINRWNCAMAMFKKKPVFGFGPGTYTFQYAPFQNSKDLTLISTNSGDLGNAHSEYFSALSEMGLIGLLSWIAVFIGSVALGMNLIYDNNRPKWQHSLATALLLGLITYYVHAFLNNYSDFDKIAAPLWGFIAGLVALKVYHKPTENKKQLPL